MLKRLLQALHTRLERLVPTTPICPILRLFLREIETAEKMM